MSRIIISVYSFGGFLGRLLSGNTPSQQNEMDSLSGIVGVLQDQLSDLRYSYENQLRSLTDNYDDLEEEMFQKHRILGNEFYKLGLEYNSLLRKFQKYEDQCLPEETRTNYVVNTFPQETFDTNHRSSYDSNSTKRKYCKI